MAGMSSYPFKCDLCGGVTELAPTYGDFKCQHCGQVYVYDECHRIELSEPQLKALRQMPVIGRLGDQVMKDIVQAFAGVPKWIPVSERLPEESERVIGWRPGLARVGEVWRNASGEWLCGDCEPAGGITHWMPLPEPPEVK